MKHTNKFFWLLICLFVCSFVFFTSCKDDSDKDKDTPQGEDGSYSNLNGEAIYFRGSFITKDPRDDPEADPASAGHPYMKTAEEEAMFEKCMQTETKYNCKIIREDSYGDSTAEFAAAFAAGQAPTDIITASYAELLDLHKANLLVDLYSLETLDAKNEEKWGSEVRKEATTYLGKLYAFPLRGSLYYPFSDYYNGAFVYNRDLYKTFDLETTPQELIENGKWTFAEFQQMLPKFCAPDLDRPLYAMSMANSLPTIAVYANGGDMIIKNKKGKYIFGYTSDAAVKAMEWAKTISAINGAISPEEGSTDFENGRATFALMSATSAINSAVKNISWIPFPYGPNVKYGTSYSSYFGYHESGTAILRHDKTPDREKMVGFIVDKLFEPTEKYGTTGYDKYIARNFFSTQEDYDVYKEHCINMHYDWSKEIVKNEKVRDILQSKVEDAVKTGSVYQKMESIEAKMNESVAGPLNGD